MAKGGLSFIKHFVIRALLDAGSDRLALRRVGGGYDLAHRLLLVYLADLADAEVERLAAGREP